MNSLPPSPPVSSGPSAIPSHELYVELATRITTQRLHYRSGDEETAAKSLHSLFPTTRNLMAKHADATDFHAVALVLLNDILRPYTARWHGWMTQNGDKTDKDGKPILKFRDEWVRRKFREELREVQPLLLGAQRVLFALSRHEPPDLSWLNPLPGSTEWSELEIECQRLAPQQPARLGGSIPLRIRPQIPLHGADNEGKSGSMILTDVLRQAESDAIRNRRQAMRETAPASEEITDAAGLALSGGGIRSATFCLGIVQTLHRRGLFNQIDYLSTVSGGGYLGTFLSSYFGSRQENHPRERVDSTFGYDPHSAESPAVRHLRNNSKYLLNGGGWGLLRIAGVMVSGFLTSLVMLLTIPLAMAWLTLFIQWLAETRVFSLIKLPWDAVPAIFQQPGGPLLALLLVTLVLLWLVQAAVQRQAHGKQENQKWVNVRNGIETVFVITALSTILIAGLSGSFLAVQWYEDLGRNLAETAKRLETASPPKWLVTALSGLVPALFGALMKRRDGSVRKWAQWLFYLTGPVFFLLTFLMFASSLGVHEARAKATPPADQPGSLFIWPFFNLGSLLSQTRELLVWGVVSLFLLLWSFLCLNINTFAPHRYYRDRLCECYLAVRDGWARSPIKRGLDSLLHGVCPERENQHQGSAVGTVRSLPLTHLGQSPAAPYHLINATLNAAASKNPELRGRDGDFFLFSRHYCGSPLTGYIRTEELEKVEPAIDLGTAMAISGAAASTNMGWKTLRRFRFLMTLFNVRLGYWMRRPGSGKLFWPLEGPGPLYFIREMLGAVHERTRYVNLSDGGHIENLAAYELLRRQCKFIICVDAGMEPGMECADLMRLQRYASIDFGIQIHFDPTDLTLLPTSYSRAYAILVKIDYAPGQAKPGRETSDQLGWMLYLKLAVTGTEPRHILDYRRQNPAFPHQTTGDQFYDEAQFESYRALGECAAESLFRDEIIGKNASNNLKVQDWFQHLANSLLSDNDEVFMKS